MDFYIDLLISISQDQRAALLRVHNRRAEDQKGDLFNDLGDEGNGQRKEAGEGSAA